jgi:hypothetical protein
VFLEFCFGLIKMLARVEKRFRGNAAYVQAGSAERFSHFDTGRFQPELRRADRGDVASWTAANDDKIKLRFHHDSPRR